MEKGLGGGGPPAAAAAGAAAQLTDAPIAAKLPAAAPPNRQVAAPCAEAHSAGGPGVVAVVAACAGCEQVVAPCAAVTMRIHSALGPGCLKQLLGVSTRPKNTSHVGGQPPGKPLGLAAHSPGHKQPIAPIGGLIRAEMSKKLSLEPWGCSQWRG
ncbi:hypothetical protein HaLaN_27135 [Haematococcus lacustris]|uniref:Uncharacterized protein n=1 Tax=Haematococcus lacustris TaxID=44745 RepID=A0A6A0A831_HAELA|nr:hypothetical protein HaLaN_27135 [Haematococcus lacustris]